MSQPTLAEELFGQAIDYAGLYPPAQMMMGMAVAKYRQFLASPQRWALARLVVPVNRLEELARVLQATAKMEKWRLAATGGNDPYADGAAVSDFNERHAALARVEVIEAVTPTPKAVTTRLAASAGIGCFCELDPGSPDFEATAATVQEFGAHAKLRMGGVVAAAIPAPETVLLFLDSCRRRNLAFKATAGLHHGLRGRYPLTYAPNAPTGIMHGLVNFALAAAWIYAGGTAAEAHAILLRDSTAGMQFTAEAIEWQGQRWTREQIVAARRFFLSVGSCSFEEPMECISNL